jgi:predicted AAA+ superfamily ATPase
MSISWIKTRVILKMAAIIRSELNDLSDWLHRKNRKPLVIRGARQVGKSTIVRQLAKKHHRFCLELNFERTPDLADFFASKDPKKIMEHLRLYTKKNLDPKETLLFLDEIQAAPHLLEVLRYFYEEYPELPVICAGSLLDFALAEPNFSVPVGRIEYYHLGPLSFENFLKSLGEDHLVDWMQTYSIDEKIPLPIHEKCLEFVKLFWLIGGMPEIVADYRNNKNFQEVSRLQQNILQTYQDDFYKYGRIKHLPLLRKIFKTVPSTVGKTLKYVHLDRDHKSAQIKESLEHLHLAKLIHFVYHSSANGLPLNAEANLKVFKLVFVDIGLQCASLGLDQLEIIKSPDSLWINRGSLAEQFIGQTLLSLKSSYMSPELFYWVREKSQSMAEVDYIYSYKNAIIPIKVKAGKTGRLKSLHSFMQEKPWSMAVRFNADTPSVSQEISPSRNKPYRLLSLPFYLAEQTERLLEASYKSPEINPEVKK